MGVRAMADERIRTHGAELLSIKNTDWKSEHEYRSLANADGNYRDIAIADCPRAIVVGEHYPEAELGVLRYRLDRIGAGHVPTRRCDWFGGYPTAR
jgi:hypothetical protein